MSKFSPYLHPVAQLMHPQTSYTPLQFALASPLDIMVLILLHLIHIFLSKFEKKINDNGGSIVTRSSFIRRIDLRSNHLTTINKLYDNLHENV